MEHKTIVIKKYENRRLYDATNSRYINLDEVEQAIQDGVDVQVVDAVSGQDITRLILTQIIMEGAKRPNSLLPLDILRHLVIASGRAGQEGALKYMKAIFDFYQNALRVVPSPLNPFDFMRSVIGAGARSPDAEAPPPENAASQQGHPAGGAKEMEALRRRVEELESLVTRLGPETPRRKRKPGTQRAARRNRQVKRPGGR